MANVLVYYAHPGHRHSTVNRAMAARAQKLEGISFFDLYAAYPRFEIDVEAEQQRLVDHDAIVFQFPFFWYSTPSLIKEWEDLVLEHGFAYGLHGHALEGKTFLNAITTGAKPNAYSRDGLNHSDLRSLLAPFEKTADLCGMRYLAPFVMFGAGRAVEDNRLDVHRNAYDDLLKALVADRFDLQKAAKAALLSDVLDDFILKGEAV